MKTNVMRLISSMIAALVLAGAASSGGQELNIEVPVPPEPGRLSAAGKDPGKPIPLRRIEPRQPDRRDASQQPGSTAPRFNPADNRSFPLEPENDVSGGPTWAMPNNRSQVPRGGPAANDGFSLDREPSWANPAAIPLRQNEEPKDAPRPRTRASQRAATASSDPRSAAHRAAGPEADSPPRAGLLNLGARLAARRAGSEEPPALLARRHRTEARDRGVKQPSAQDGTHR
jgi:hypothetical protein